MRKRVFTTVVPDAMRGILAHTVPMAVRAGSAIAPKSVRRVPPSYVRRPLGHVLPQGLKHATPEVLLTAHVQAPQIQELPTVRANNAAVMAAAAVAAHARQGPMPRAPV